MSGVGCGVIGALEEFHQRYSWRIGGSHVVVEASPEKMHGADLAQKPGAEFLQYLIDPYQDAPEFMRGFTKPVSHSIDYARLTIRTATGLQ